MKTWIKRTLIGFAAAATLVGGLGAWAHSRYGNGWHGMSIEDRADIKQRVVARVAARLTLDATQQARLAVLADKVDEQHAALRAGTDDPRAAMQSLIAGNTFDRTAAQALIQQKLAAINTKSPEVVTALGDFYDGLSAEQQAKVRDFLAKGGHRGRHGRWDGGERGEHRD